MICVFRGFELFAIKLFKKVFIYIQPHSLQASRGVEKLELPNNRKGGEFEARRVFRFFEFFDRGKRVKVGCADVCTARSESLGGGRVLPGIP